eukprot:CAMPEP_0169107128 /NCGR_PEP_ID=MMETSP1015-20121227/24714_1 /TAXON_ID=342587 /ORGANISM="Karlodinium micrum, Strain CCMP2283" /LENGTH=151 /DNA_ID=CAMNT_0009168633 /DNA_START=62 /DNA_END=517 /DNA_ORIENTATION=-
MTGVAPAVFGSRMDDHDDDSSVDLATSCSEGSEEHNTDSDTQKHTCAKNDNARAMERANEMILKSIVAAGHSDDTTSGSEDDMRRVRASMHNRQKFSAKVRNERRKVGLNCDKEMPTCLLSMSEEQLVARASQQNVLAIQAELLNLMNDLC